MAIVLKNNTGGDLSYPEYGGIVVPASGQLDISDEFSDQEFLHIYETSALLPDVDAGNITVNDGTDDLIASEVFNIANQIKKGTASLPSAWLEPVFDKDLDTPPASPADGDRYIVKSPGQGAWVGLDDGEVVQWAQGTTSWSSYPPADGDTVVTTDDSNVLIYDENAGDWVYNAGITAFLPLAGGHMSGNIYMDNQRILNTPEPHYSSEYVNRKFAQRYKTTHTYLASHDNVVLNGVQVIDGITSTTGDRVLAADQTTPLENGIWIANDGGAWVRSNDMYGTGSWFNTDFHEGLVIQVMNGVTHAGATFRQNSADGKIGVNTMTFAEYGKSINDIVTDSIGYGTNTGDAPVQTSSNSTWTEAISLSFTPPDDGDYAVELSYEFQIQTSTTALVGRIQRDNTTDLTVYQNQVTNGGEWCLSSGFGLLVGVLGAVPITLDFDIQSSNSGKVVQTQNVNIIARRIG